MAEFIAFNPEVEVNGQTILSFINGMGAFKNIAFDILRKNNIENPGKDKWYLQQDWLNAFKEISLEIGDATLKIIGQKIPENANWPSKIRFIDKALESIDIAYHLNHRLNNVLLYNECTGLMQEGIGHYSVEKKDDNLIIMECMNPYPCNFDLGIIEAVTTKFKLNNSRVVIKHLEGECRKNGSEYCKYSIKWS